MFRTVLNTLYLWARKHVRFAICLSLFFCGPRDRPCYYPPLVGLRGNPGIWKSGNLEIWDPKKSPNWTSSAWNYVLLKMLARSRLVNKILILVHATPGISHFCPLPSMQSLTSLARCLLLGSDNIRCDNSVSQLPFKNHSKDSLQSIWSLGASGEGSGWYLRVCPTLPGNLEIWEQKRRQQTNKQNTTYTTWTSIAPECWQGPSE